MKPPHVVLTEMLAHEHRLLVQAHAHLPLSQKGDALLAIGIPLALMTFGDDDEKRAVVGEQIKAFIAPVPGAPAAEQVNPVDALTEWVALIRTAYILTHQRGWPSADMLEAMDAANQSDPAWAEAASIVAEAMR